MTKKSIILAIVSGFALVFAFPPFNILPVAWFGITPLFFAIHDKRPREAFFIGFIWGIVFFLGTVYWVVNSMVNYGGVPVFASVIVLLLLVIVLSLYFAVFGCLAFSLQPSAFRLFFIPCLWVSLEYIRTFLFTGFPWVLLGYSQTTFLHIMQSSDITGVYGVSFLIVMVNVFLFRIVRYFIQPSAFGLRHYIEGIAVFLILILALGYGYFRIGQIDRLTQNWRQIKVGIAQGNINQAHKWDPAYQAETVEIYRQLSMAMADKGIDIIIWPETAIPFWLQSDEKLGPIVFDIAKTLSVNLLTGSPAYRYSGDGLTTSYFNSVFLISKKGEIAGRYDKVHLVPFGEYVPLKRFLPFKKLVAGAGDFSAGKDLKPLSINGDTFGVLICFEAIFPRIAREFTKSGADFLITVTNDAWFGRSGAPFQHLSQAAARSIENRVFLVRAANTGISAIVDPVGRIKQKSGIFTRETLVDAISLKEKSFTTFYTRYGDVFAIVCMIISIVMFINPRYFKKARL